MKPVTVFDVDRDQARVCVDLHEPLVWLEAPARLLCLEPHAAQALGYALLSAADAAKYPKKKE